MFELVYIPEKIGAHFVSLHRLDAHSNATFAPLESLVLVVTSRSRDLGQIRIATEGWLNVSQNKKRSVSNIVFMGMGEPLLNLPNVLPALDVIRSDLGYGISKRRVTVSTSGIVLL